MGIISALLGARAERSTPATDPFFGFMDRLFGRPTITGVKVSEESALQFAPVYACVRVISETIASLPLPVYRQALPRGKIRDPSHPLYTVLHDMGNSEMTAFTVRETLMVHVLLWGNAYAEIERDRLGRIIGLWPLRPDRMVMKRRANPDGSAGDLVYCYRLPNGEEKQFEPPQIFHLLGLSPDGIQGYSVIGLHREAIGLGMAYQEFAARFFGNNTHLGIVVEIPGKLTEKAEDNLIKSLDDKNGGLSKAWRLKVLEEGVKIHQVGMPLKDAEFLLSRKYTRAEVASLFRVPLHLIQDLERSTNNNIEHQGIEFSVHTIRPWCVRIEQTIKWKLLTPAERKEYTAEHIIDGLLRGDSKTRHETYSAGFNMGMYSPNDMLEMENRNPIGPEGDVHMVPLNMIPLAQAMSMSVQNRVDLILAEAERLRAAGGQPPRGGEAKDEA